MPVIPNFSAFGPKAELGANFIAGARTAISRDQGQAEIALGGARLAQQARQAQQQIQLGQQKLAQDAVQNEMEFEMKNRVLEQATLHDQQKLAIENQMQIQRLGLEKQRIDDAAQRTQMMAQQAARQFEAQQRFHQIFNEGGGTPEAAMKAGLSSPEMPGVYPAALRQSMPNPEEKASLPLGTVSNVAGRPEQIIQTSRNSVQVLPPVKKPFDPAEAPRKVPGTDWVEVDGKFFKQSVDQNVKDDRAELKRLIVAEEKDDYGARSAIKARQGEELKASAKTALEKYKERKKRIVELRRRINAAQSAEKTGTNTNLQKVGEYTIEER